MNSKSKKTMFATLRRFAPLVLAVSASLMLTLAAACTSTMPNSASAKGTKSGSELWAQNCSRCHNFRSPSEFSDSQWNAVLMHMRVRANLTGDEHRSIRDFLKASN